MARARSFPSDFLKDPDIIALSGADECLILIGLILKADDHGRGFAHCTLLGREIRGYAPEQIESALHALEALELVTLYEVGRHRYYSLPRWNEWQKLREPAKSKFPAPPDAHEERSEEEQQVSPLSSKKGEETLRNFQEVQKPASEDEEEKEGEREEEGEGKTPKVIAFPVAHTNSTIDTDAGPLTDNEVEQSTHQVAAILKLPVDNALTRIVEDYVRDPVLNFYGEADAAREWIEDTKRNTTRKRMSPAWFRTWLKREHDQALTRQAQRASLPVAATGTAGPNGGSQRAAPPAQGATKPPSLMNLEQQYQAAATGAKGERP